MIEAAQATQAQAIHPGYGFLAENADFAEAVRAAGLIFVGPTPEAIRAMGSKTGARTLMQAAGVPVVPGYHGAADAAFAEMAGTIGYPILIKAAAGGGGRGLRVVDSAADLESSVESAEHEAASAFGDGSVFIEKYIANARHIEFQVFGDAHGNVVHLFERECSIQRRHQKLIEESPSPLLAGHPELRTLMAAAAVSAARAVSYRNAGTIEFIVDPDTLAFYFLEMNTRLQVEHPVTEAVTGLDLVHLQLRVAAGEPLPVTQEQILARGYALECRVIAEDPAAGFLPSSGPLLVAREPQGPGVRVDAGYGRGDEISLHYDSLMAKVIAFGPSRAAAIARMDQALARYVILGLTTNIAFLRAVLAHPQFQAGTATTRFLETHLADWHAPAPGGDEVWIAAALADALALPPTRNGLAASEAAEANRPWSKADGFRLGRGG